MSLVERARERVEEIRAKGAMAVVEEKFPKIKEIRGGGVLGGSSGSSPELPSLKDVREKGVLGVLEERFPKVKEIRERGILARLKGAGGGSGEPSPATESPPVIEKKELRVRGARVIL